MPVGIPACGMEGTCERRLRGCLFGHLQENGDWEGAFPMPVRITSALNEILEDVIESELCPSPTCSAASASLWLLLQAGMSSRFTTLNSQHCKA